MRRILGTAAAVALLVGTAGCGTDDEVRDPGSGDSAGGTGGTGTTTTAEPSATPSTPAGSTVVLVSGSAAGGTSSDTLIPVTTEAELAAFTSQLTSDAFVTEVRDAVDEARASLGGDGAVLAAVVTLGCDTPEKVTHTPGSDDVSVAAPKVGTEVQCLVPVTTVAVVADPSA